MYYLNIYQKVYDFTPNQKIDVCKSKDDPTVIKGYFAQKKGKTGRQKAWAYMTDAYGGI